MLPKMYLFFFFFSFDIEFPDSCRHAHLCTSLERCSNIMVVFIKIDGLTKLCFSSHYTILSSFFYSHRTRVFFVFSFFGSGEGISLFLVTVGIFAHLYGRFVLKTLIKWIL